MVIGGSGHDKRNAEASGKIGRRCRKESRWQSIRIWNASAKEICKKAVNTK